MPVKVAAVMQVLEKIAPKRLAYDWDNVGLLVGDPKTEISKILVCLDINEYVVHEAVEEGVELIISHHPIIYKPLENLRWDTPLGSVIKKLNDSAINVYCAHTNLDMADNGVNKALFEKLGLTDSQILKVERTARLFKLVVFVPKSHAEKVRMTLGDVGAGWIGNYSHCAFACDGVGSFKPLEDANPYLGEAGRIETVEEVRLETIVEERLLNSVVRSLIKVHPYEEVAYDIFPLENKGKEYGLGRIGRYAKPLLKKEFIAMLKEQLQPTCLKVAGNLPELVEKVAVCGGSGGGVLHQAAFKGAQVVVTGDVSYHQAQEAVLSGLCVLDAGHSCTEKVIVPHLAGLLKEEFNKQKVYVEVLVSKIKTDPWVVV
ncbi:MAG: Nif3-like dinuclear metal center hexameric protein [Bacillota bacterium]